MDKNDIKEFGYSWEVFEQIDNKYKKQTALLVANIIAALVCLGLWISNYEENPIYALLAVMGIIGLIVTAVEVNKLSIVHTNIKKNHIKVTSDYIYVTYVENFKTAESDKFLKLELENIEKIETNTPNIVLDVYYNAQIYHTGGIIKVSIDNPKNLQSILTKSDE